MAAAKTLDRDKLARELLKIHRDNAKVFAREGEIKSALKSDADENFKVTIDSIGEVSVSAPRPKCITGTAPELIVEAFLGLPEKEQKQLKRHGLVVVVDVVKAAYYGSVTTKVF